MNVFFDLENNLIYGCEHDETVYISRFEAENAILEAFSPKTAEQLIASLTPVVHDGTQAFTFTA